jgi:subtilisin-like proprotein convertase family protein
MMQQGWGLTAIVALVACAQAGSQPSAEGGGQGDPDDRPAVESNCENGIDDDRDGFVDCKDADCREAAACLREEVCDDGIDNDQDRAIDCADSDCNARNGCQFGRESRCDDGMDNDADGAADCTDSDCDGVGICETGAERSCADGADNDGDGAADCADSDCANMPHCIPEQDCADGVDNDSDGATDCSDADCDGVGACEFGAETSCADGLDNDGNGHIDCADDRCRLAAACVLSCPDGSDPARYAAPGLPRTLPDRASTEVAIEITNEAIVTAVAVLTNLAHTYVGDLTLALRAPSGTRLVLSNRLGGGGDGYSNTVFTDAASTPIRSGSAPFVGTYRPEASLNQLAGTRVTGTWTLEVTDHANGDTGVVGDFALFVCTCGGAVSCESGAACADGADNDGDGAVDCADDDCRGHGACTAESDCQDGIDNDSDGAIDCADPGCWGTPPCERSVEVSCSDGVDNDGNGQTDCADSHCQWACTALSCGATQDLAVYSAADLPLAIVDQRTVTSVIPVGRTGVVGAAAVRTTIEHGFTGDLDITLAAPAGTRIDLSSDNGGSGEDFRNTVFTDSAAVSITSGTAPFSGAYQPEQPLSRFNGLAVAGDWQFRVADDANGDTGSLIAVDLALCITPQ